MKKKITGSVLSAGAIVLGLAAVGCGGAIENAADGWAMLGYTLLAIVLGCAALALAGQGLVAEQRKEPQKIHKVPENTVTPPYKIYPAYKQIRCAIPHLLFRKTLPF